MTLTVGGQHREQISPMAGKGGSGDSRGTGVSPVPSRWVQPDHRGRELLPQGPAELEGSQKAQPGSICTPTPTVESPTL